MSVDWSERAIMFAVLVVAVMIHEVAHGLAALWCGDPTARDAKRISLNPLRHIDLVGTLLLPGLLALSGSSVVFGWAKPVPINLWRTRNPRRALWLTAVAGPLSNLLQALLAAAVLQFAPAVGGLPHWLILVLFYTCAINVVLLVFNLIPIPPLDGSRVVAAFLPRGLAQTYLSIERYGFVLIFLLLNTRALRVVTSPIIEGLLGWLVPDLGS